MALWASTASLRRSYRSIREYRQFFIDSIIRNYPTRWGSVRASRTNNVDLGIYKNFSIMEKVKLQARFETYNTFNHARFAAPNSDPTSSSFGVVSPAQQNAPRTVQLALKLSF